MPVLNAVDVARYQQNVDWQVMKDSGVIMAIYKATQGKGYVDPYFTINRTKTKAAGFEFRMPYHFLSSNIIIKDQVDHFVRTVGYLNPGEGVMLDAERDNLTQIEVTLEQCIEWCERVEAIFHRPVAVYTGAFVDSGRIWRSDVLYNGHRPRVLAAYTSEERMKKIVGFRLPDMWQYSSDGPVPGVIGRCDMNHVYDWTKFREVCGLRQHVPPVTELPPKEDEMAKDKILTNKEPLFEHAPLAFKFLLMEDGSKRHLGIDEYDPMYLGSIEYPLSNEQLGKIPNYTPTTAPVETCRYESPPTGLSITLTGSGTLS